RHPRVRVGEPFHFRKRTRRRTLNPENRRAASGSEAARSVVGGDASAVLDGGDLELDRHLFGDQNPTRFQGCVPADAPVLAVDDGRALEADAGLTPRVDGGSGELEVEGD